MTFFIVHRTVPRTILSQRRPLSGAKFVNAFQGQADFFPEIDGQMLYRAVCVSIDEHNDLLFLFVFHFS